MQRDNILTPESPEFDSALHWGHRYRHRGNSGAGVYNRLAAFKAEVINHFIKEKGLRSAIEFGAGDGNQLALYSIPEYLGLDVSQTVISRLQRIFASDPAKRFMLVDDYQGERAELSMSIDVIFHLVEDAVFDAYMTLLFNAAEQYVVIYSSNREESAQKVAHVRHRKFTRWVMRNREEWFCRRYVSNKYPEVPGDSDTSFCDFYFFEKKNSK